MLQNFGLLRQSTGTARLQAIPIPKLRDDYIVVRTVAVAINPTDWTSLEAPGDNGTIVGCDYSGVVEDVGKDVTRPFKKGDRIAGFAHGANDANPENGAFARYISVKGDLQMHIPNDVSFEEAATVGAGCGSAAYALYKVLKLPIPGPSLTGAAAVEATQGERTILIYGGSTATGTLAIQFAKLSGWKVITTSSPAHFSLLKERSADCVYDYREADVGTRIRESSDNSITRVLDCIASDSTAAICASATTSNSDDNDKKVYCSLLPVECPRTDVGSVFFLGYSMSGEAYIAEGEHYAAQPDDFEFARDWYGRAEALWTEGKWKAHPQRVEARGLDGIEDGMKEMKEGRVRGVKLVYRVDETEWPSAS